MRKSIVRTLWGVALLGVASLATASLRETPLPVDSARVVRCTVQQTVRGSGMIRWKQRYTISAPVGGSIDRSTWHAGDSIHKGEILAHIAPELSQPLDERSRAELQSRLAAARVAEAEAGAALERARLTAAQAERDAARLRQLVSQGALPPQQAETAETAANAQVAEVKVASLARQRLLRERQALEAQLVSPRSVAQSTQSGIVEIAAPADGVVLRAQQESAGPIQIGAPILEIGDPEQRDALIELTTQEAVRVAPGNAVTLLGYGLEQPLAAVVKRVEPAAFTKVSALGVEEQRVNVVVEPKDNAPVYARLGHEFHVEATIVVDQKKDVLCVPTAAVFPRAGHFAVYQVRDGHVQVQNFVAGIQGDDAVQVKGGLALGDVVVVYPSEQVHVGAPVKIQ